VRRTIPLRRRIAFVVVADLLVLAVLAVVGEIACRLLAPQDDYGSLPETQLGMLRFSDDIYLGWELQPGRLDHNAAGFRGREYDRAKPPGVWRIAVIGDSVTYGLGVTGAEAYASVLEARLNSAGPGRIEVLNFGVPGFNPYQEYTLLTSRVQTFDPDLVIMTFTPDDVETSPVMINVGGSMCLLRNHFEGIGLLNNSLHWALFRASHLYRFLYKAAALMLAAKGQDFDAVYVQPDASWQNVLRVAAWCREHGKQFLLVLSPFLLPHHPSPDQPLAQQEQSWQAYQRAFDRIRQLAAENGIETFDLGPLYAAHAGQMKLKPEDHEHPNPRGHAWIAEALAPRVLAVKNAAR